MIKTNFYIGVSTIMIGYDRNGQNYDRNEVVKDVRP